MSKQSPIFLILITGNKGKGLPATVLYLTYLLPTFCQIPLKQLHIITFYAFFLIKMLFFYKFLP